jgi:hypothetical protein
MIFCSRATRGLGRPSLDARSGGSISPIPEEIASELGGVICKLDRLTQSKALQAFSRFGDKQGECRNVHGVLGKALQKCLLAHVHSLKRHLCVGMN